MFVCCGICVFVWLYSSSTWKLARFSRLMEFHGWTQTVHQPFATHRRFRWKNIKNTFLSLFFWLSEVDTGSIVEEATTCLWEKRNEFKQQQCQLIISSRKKGSCTRKLNRRTLCNTWNRDSLRLFHCGIDKLGPVEEPLKMHILSLDNNTMPPLKNGETILTLMIVLLLARKQFSV